MNNREIRFRESFRGYNRDDVKAYIEQLSILFARKEADMHAYISDLENQLKIANDKISSSRTNDEYDELLSKLEEAQNEIKRLTEENETAVEAEKNRLYDEMTTQVGSIIVSANTNAEKIISDAKEEANRIKCEADIYASSVRNEANKQRDEIVGSVNAKVRDFAVECVTRYGTIIGETNVKLGNIADNLKSHSERLLESLETKSKEIEAQLIIRNEDK